jgi:hypothetical protein
VRPFGGSSEGVKPPLSRRVVLAERQNIYENDDQVKKAPLYISRQRFGCTFDMFILILEFPRIFSDKARVEKSPKRHRVGAGI